MSKALKWSLNIPDFSSTVKKLLTTRDTNYRLNITKSTVTNLSDVTILKFCPCVFGKFNLVGDRGLEPLTFAM